MTLPPWAAEAAAYVSWFVGEVDVPHTALWFEVYQKTNWFRFYFKHYKGVLGVLLALRLFLDLIWNFEDLKNVFSHFVYNQTESEIQSRKALYFWLGTGPPFNP